LNYFDSRDRTAEFFSTVNAIQKQLELQSGAVSPPAPEPIIPFSEPLQDITHKSQFTKAAQRISKGICVVSQDLEELVSLAKDRSLFNDPAHKINRLTSKVKSDINSLNKEIDALHRWASEHPSRGSRQSSLNSNAIVQNLQLELAGATKSFTEILQLRTQNMKDQNSRRKEFGSSSRASLRQRSDDERQLRQRRHGVGLSGRLLGDDELSSLDNGDDPLAAPLLPDRDLEQQQAVMPNVQDEYLSQRTAAVENIERTIVELGQMYQRLVTIVSMQEEVTLRIDENMDTALHHVKEGGKELEKYLASISGSQWLILKVFFVLMVFIVFFVVFIM